MNTRSRRYNLTINPEADCFSNIDDILKRYCSNEDKYAYIKHDKDVSEDGTLKHEHYHVVVEFKNAHTFDSMLKTFKGAHLEECKNVRASYQYLIHLNDPSKTRYDFKDIITNVPQYVKGHLEATTQDFPQLDPDKILFYWDAGCKTYFSFVATFGQLQVTANRLAIFDFLREVNGMSAEDLHNQFRPVDVSVLGDELIDGEM